MSVNIVLKTILDDKGIKNAQKAFSKLGGTIKTLGASLGVALGTRAFIDSAKAAAEDAKSQALLAGQLRNTIGANDDLIASVEASISKMQLAAAVADDTIRPAFAQLVRATGDVAQANSLMQLALDISAGTGRDLQSVTIALSKAYQGNASSLSRLGIKVEDGADAFAMLREQFSGAAEQAAQNDPFRRLSISIGEAQEQIGRNLLPQINSLANYLATAEFTTAFSSLVISIGNVIKQLDNLAKIFTGQGLFTGIMNFLASFGKILAERIWLIGEFANMMKKFFIGDWVGLAQDFVSFPERWLKYKKELQDSFKNESLFVPIELTPYIQLNNQKFGKETESQFAKVRKIIKDFQAKIIKAEQDYADTRYKINDEYEQNLKKLREDSAQAQLNIVQESIDRLRNAFRSATQVGLGDLFGTQTMSEIVTQVTKLSDR